MDTVNPYIMSILIPTIFSLIFLFSETLNIPFENIVYSIMPLSMNVLPAIVRSSKRI